MTPQSALAEVLPSWRAPRAPVIEGPLLPPPRRAAAGRSGLRGRLIGLVLSVAAAAYVAVPAALLVSSTHPAGAPARAADVNSSAPAADCFSAGRGPEARLVRASSAFTPEQRLATVADPALCP